VNIELSDVITVILNWIGFISDEDGTVISNSLHTIRDHITLTMGVTVGTEGATKVAQVETKIEQLADQIFDEYSLYVALSIDLKLWTASGSLDCALICLAKGCSDLAGTQIILSINELQGGKCLINKFKDEGKIPAAQANALITSIDGFIAELEPLYAHITHIGDCTGGDMYTHQGTGENSTPEGPDSTGSGGQTGAPNIEIPAH
jgi:hypothetical protein